MKRFLVAVLVVSVALINVSPASAQFGAGSYDYDYDNLNIYWDEGLTITVASLTSAAEYVWTVQELDSSGNVVRVLASRVFTGGTTTQFHFNNFEFPTNRFFPFRVVDNYSNILSYHFLAPWPGDEWLASNGNTAQNEKQSVGAQSIAQGCVAPPYNNNLNNGWHHTGFACSVYTETGSYILLHYRSSIGDYPSGDRIVFDQISPVNNGVLDIEIDEMIDFNSFGRGTTYPLGGSHANKFVVLNTSGESLPFVNGTAAAISFAVGDNPMRATFDPGAYTCSRLDASSTWISDCESVFLVGNDPLRREFHLTFAKSEVPPGNIQNKNTQIMNFGGRTPAIWNGYSGSYLFEDSVVGVVSTELFNYTTSGSISYLVDVPDSFIGTVVDGLWRITPNALNTGLATPAEMYMLGVGSGGLRPIYLISEDEFITNINVIISALGLDSDSGKFIWFIGLFLIGAAIFWWYKFPPLAFSFWYVISGGLMVASGLGSSLFNIVFIATAVPVLWAGFTMRRRSEMEF